MKIENIREVKTRLSRYIKELSKTGSVIITKNGTTAGADPAVVMEFRFRRAAP